MTVAENLLPTVVRIVAHQPGAIVGLLGGVHGDELEGVIAARRLARELQGCLNAGEVRIAAPAHPAAWGTHTRESPVDGSNLARVFPGRPDGSPTERVAHTLTDQVIHGADLLIDLHSAGADFVMPFLCGYQSEPGSGSETAERAAETFGADFTWRHEGQPAPGRSLSAAHQLGVPAIYVEGHGGRSVLATELDDYVDGVRRVLHLLGMIADAPTPTRRPIHVHGDGNTDAGITAPTSGFVIQRTSAGSLLTRNEPIASIVDEDGRTITEIVAPTDGHVMLLRRDARVTVGDTVCIVAAQGKYR